jgi:hypothetical protein
MKSDSLFVANEVSYCLLFLGVCFCCCCKRIHFQICHSTKQQKYKIIIITIINYVFEILNTILTAAVIQYSCFSYGNRFLKKVYNSDIEQID